jgi:hypothetical protein
MSNYFMLLNEGELSQQHTDDEWHACSVSATISNSRVTHFNIAETWFSINIHSKLQANKNSTYLHFFVESDYCFN